MFPFVAHGTVTQLSFLFSSHGTFMLRSISFLLMKIFLSWNGLEERREKEDDKDHGRLVASYSCRS